MSQDILRIGIVGAGANTRLRHIPGFQALRGVQISTVCNRSRESSQRVATEFGIPRVSDSWEDVVQDPEIDAVCIGTWPYLHADISIAALQNGKHVLTEARMARNAREALAMVEASAANPQLTAQVVPSPFTFPLDAKIRELVEEGEIGDLREVVVEHTHSSYSRSDDPLTWRQNIHYSGYNILTFGIYYEALQRWLGRDVAVLRAMGAVHTPERLDPETGEVAAVELPDSIVIHGSYPEGAGFTGRFSGIEAGTPRNEYRLNGSSGTLRIDVGAAAIFLSREGTTETEVHIPQQQQSGWRVEADFVDSIRSGTPVSLTSFEQGLRYMKVTEAAYRSWKSGGEEVSVD